MPIVKVLVPLVVRVVRRVRYAGLVGVRVAVQLGDGRSLESSVVSQRGDATNPASREDLLGKFRLLAGPTLGDEGVARTIDTAGRTETLENITELTDCWRETR